MDEGRYENQGKIGEGGMGQVLRVHDRYLQRDVAVKTLLPGLSSDNEYHQRFVREARAAGQFEHPNIPPVHELAKAPDGSPYFTMRLVQGQTLEAIIAQLKADDAETHTRFTFIRRLQIAQQICDAIHYAHKLGYIHRDIKPANIMVGPFGEVQVMDWGLALALNKDAQKPAKPTLTADGDFIGTLAYASPEQIAGDKELMNERVDLYSIGALLYELCALEPPFNGANPTEILTAILTKTPRAPEEFSSPRQGRVPREISRLILKAMQRDPQDRFASAEDMKFALQQVIEGETPPVCPHTAYKRGLSKFMRFLDNHHSAPLMFLVYLWTVLPLILGAVIAYQHFAARP